MINKKYASQRKYLQNKRKITLTFTDEEFSQIENYSKNNKIKKATFIKKLILEKTNDKNKTK
jgi:hypothetical protein